MSQNKEHVHLSDFNWPDLHDDTSERGLGTMREAMRISVMSEFLGLNPLVSSRQPRTVTEFSQMKHQSQENHKKGVSKVVLKTYSPQRMCWSIGHTQVNPKICDINHKFQSSVILFRNQSKKEHWHQFLTRCKWSTTFVPLGYIPSSKIRPQESDEQPDEKMICSTEEEMRFEARLTCIRKSTIQALN